MLQKALMVQVRVVKALILRETKTRFGDHKLGYLWAVLEPLLFVAIFVGLYGLMGRTSVSGMPRAQFMLTGFIPFFFFRNTMQQTISAIDSNRGLLTFPQVTLFDVILARALLEIATLSVVFFLLILGFEAAGLRIEVQDPLKVMAVLGLLGMTGLGFGAAFAMLKPLFPSVQQMVGAVMGRPLFLSSGLFFTAEMLPDRARELLLYNPILHMIEMLRSAFFVQFDSRYADPDYAIASAAIVLCLGLLFQRALNRRVLKLRA
jgi:capsular polysaccharide transport system permease protein